MSGEGENEFVFCKKNDLSFKKFKIIIQLLMKYWMKKLKKQKRAKTVNPWYYRKRFFKTKAGF